MAQEGRDSVLYKIIAQRLEHITNDESRASGLPAAERYPIMESRWLGLVAWLETDGSLICSLIDGGTFAWERGLCACVPHVDLDRDSGNTGTLPYAGGERFSTGAVLDSVVASGRVCSAQMVVCAKQTRMRRSMIQSL